MKSKVILFCVLLFCSKMVDANPHSEDLRQRVKPSLNWQVDQNAQDTKYFDTDFTQTRNVNPMPIPVIQQDSIPDYDSNQERYTSNYDGYGYNKSPVTSPSGKQLLGSYNTQIDGRRLESYPPRVESYPPQVGFDSQQFRNPNWRSQNPYTNSAPSGVLITDSERPLVNTVQESYRAPVQYPQPKYVPSSNREFYPPNRSYLRREQFKNPLTDDADDGKYVANFAHRFGSTGPVPYENFSEGQHQAGASEIKTRGGQRYLQNPAVIGDTLAAQSENIKYLENYSATSDLINTGPLTNYDDGSLVISEVENYGLDSRPNNLPVSYESYKNGQDTASDLTARLTGGRRHTQSFAPQSGIGYKESPAVISTDTLKDLRIDRSRSDLSNAAHITNYGDDSSPAIYSSGSRLSNVRVPYEIYGEAQVAASKVKSKPIGGQKYVQNTVPQSRLMYNNIPAVIATDNIVPASNQEDSSTVISAVDNTNIGSKPNNPTTENIEKKAPVDISKILSHVPLARRYPHNYRTESESNNIVRDDSYNSASTIISETVEEKSGEKLVPANMYSGISSTSTNTESDVPALKSSSSIPTNNNLNHLKNQKSSSGITELSLIDLLSKTDIEKFMSGNTKRFLVIHPNKTVEYVDDIESNSHQNSKVRLLNTKPKNVVDSEGDGAQLLKTVKDNPVDESDSNLLENHSNLNPLRPHTKQQVVGDSLKPLTSLSKPITPLVNQKADDNTPYKPLTFPENYPEKKNKHSKPFRPNIRHPVRHYESKAAPVNQPAYSDSSNPPFSDGSQLAVDKNFKPQHSNENHPSDENISNSSSPDENQPSSDNNAKTLSSKENKSVDDNDLIPLSLRKRWPGHHHKNQPVDQSVDYNSNPSSSNENQPENENNSKSSILNGNQSRDETDSYPLSPNEDQSGNDKIPKNKFMNENQSEDHVDSKPSHSYKRYPKSKPSIKQSANVDNSNLSYSDQNQPSDDDKPLYPYKIQPVQGNQPDIEKEPKQHLSNENRTGDENDSNSSSPDENQPSNDNNAKTSSSKENKPGNDNDYIPLSPRKRWLAHHYNSKLHKNQPTYDYNSNPSSSDENQPENKNNSKSSVVNQSGDDSDLNPLSPDEDHSGNDKISKKMLLDENQSDDDVDSKQRHRIDRYKLANADDLNPSYSEQNQSSDHQPGDENDSDSSSPSEDPLGDENDSNSSSTSKNQPGDENDSNSSSPSENQPGDENDSKSSSPGENQVGVENDSKSSSTSENQAGDENDSNSSSPSENQAGDENDSNSSSPGENQAGVENDSNSSSPGENQPGDENDSNSSSPSENQAGDENDSNSSSPSENQAGDENDSNSSSPGENQPGDENDSNSSSPSENQAGDENDSNSSSPSENQAGDENDSNSSSPGENQAGVENDSNSSSTSKNQPGDENDSNSSSPSENQPGDENDSKSSSPGENQVGVENDSNSSSTSENQPGDENDSNSSSPGENQAGVENDSNSSSTSENQPVDDNNSNLSSSKKYDEEPEFSNLNQSQDAEILPENNTGDDKNSDSLTPDENQLKDGNNAMPSDGKSKKSKTLHPRKRKRNNKRKSYENQSENDDTSPEKIPEDDNISNSTSPDENMPKDKKISKPLRLYEKQVKNNSEPTPPVLSKTDEIPDSATVSPTTSNYTALPKLQVANKYKDRSIRRKSTTSSPIVTSTTLRLEETSEDQIITISPIEQVTDNVRDVPPVTTSTTTAKPIDIPGESDTIKDDSNEQDDNNANSSSEELDSTSTPTENTSGDKTTKKTKENNDIQTDDKSVKSQASKEKNDIQTIQSAVYNSSELLNRNTDVPAESDIYSPVTTSHSMQNGVNTGDASGDYTLELEQPETDVTITVSSNKDNDSEDDVIIINVEVSESTGSSDNDKSLLISIDTDEDNDDDSEASQDTGVDGQSSDCKNDHNDGDGKGKKLEIDMSKIQGEPTMWIRTTNQDFIEKLTEKNDTAFDIVYFFNMVNQPVIEREKETTFYCNGTVVITTKETTYPNKDDSRPNVEKKMETMQIEDYKQSGLEYSSD